MRMEQTSQSTRIFVCLYLGYMILTYIRKAVSFASPAVLEIEGMSKSQFGLILSSQMLGYTLGKLFGGVLVDWYSPSALLIISLVLSALTVLTFTMFETVTAFAVCWFINGFSQGPSWPACGVLIKRWFPPDKFGTWWSVLSTSMNVSGTAGPILSAFLLSVYSWRVTLNFAGTCAFAVAGMAALLLTDRPPDATDSAGEGHTADSGKKATLSWRRDVSSLLRQPVFVAVCCNYLLVSTIRSATSDWGHLYLIHDKKHSHLTGSSFTSCQEIGGIVGSLAAGYISDFLMRRKMMRYNPRHLFLFFCTIVQSTSVFFFLSSVSSSTSTLLICLIGFCIGFGLYGSIALFGVVSMESAKDRLAGTAHSIASLAASVGMVLAGYPLSVIATRYSWHSVFLLVQLLGVFTTIIALFCVRSSTTISGAVVKQHAS